MFAKVRAMMMAMEYSVVYHLGMLVSYLGTFCRARFEHWVLICRGIRDSFMYKVVYLYWVLKI